LRFSFWVSSALKGNKKAGLAGRLFRAADAVTSWRRPSLRRLERAQQQAPEPRQAQQQAPERILVAPLRNRQARMLPARRRGLYVSCYDLP
jgi:hypothetical protein